MQLFFIVIFLKISFLLVTCAELGPQLAVSLCLGFLEGYFQNIQSKKNGDIQVHFQGNIQGYKKHSKNFRDMPNTITAVTESSILGALWIWFPGPSYHANNEKVAGLGPYHVLPLKFNTTPELTPRNIESPTRNIVDWKCSMHYDDYFFCLVWIVLKFSLDVLAFFLRISLNFHG